MSRLNFLAVRVRLHRVALLAIMLSAVPAVAQEVVVTISMNSCWNVCSRAASQAYYDWLDNGETEEAAAEVANMLFEGCTYSCEGPY